MPYVEHSWYTKEEFEYIDDDRELVPFLIQKMNGAKHKKPQFKDLQQIQISSLVEM